jgi:hypothetical protein
MKGQQIARLITPEIALGIAIAAVGIYFVSRTFKAGEQVAQLAGEGVKQAADLVNPISPTNAIQRAGTAIIQAVDPKAKEQDLTLSTKIIDWFNFGGVNSYDPNDPPRKVAAVGK